jgi:hypothetical protein
MNHPVIFHKCIFTICILLLPFFFNFTYGQNWTSRENLQNKSTHAHKFKAKATFLMGVGVLSTANHSGEIKVSIPYQTTNYNGFNIAHVFNGDNSNLVSKKSPQLMLGLDISKPSYVINFSIEFNTSFIATNNIYIGYGKNIYLKKLQEKTMARKIKQYTWLLRPSLSFSSFTFSSGNLGSITNTNTTINILGEVANPTYNHHSTKGYSQYGITADNLVISYKQNELGILPKIALCTNPYKKMFTVQIFISYFLPITKTGSLLMVQESNSSKYDYSFGNSNMKKNPQVIATYDNKRFQSTPFKLNEISAGIILGINL